jgi:hypothetical protein
MRLDFSSLDRNNSLEFEESIRHDHDASASGKENLAREMFAELRKALSLADYHKSLPETDELMESRAAGRRTDPMAFLDIMNIPAMWQEINNTFLDLRYLLGQAKAYKDLEPRDSTPISDSLCAYLHFEKMHNLNLAMFLIVKIQDLVVRLLQEGFSGNLIDVDYDEEGWEGDLRFHDAKRGMKRLLDSGQLGQSEHDGVMGALEFPTRSPAKGMIIKYRNRLAHGILPSVDYSEIFTHVQDRAGEAIRDASGNLRARRYSIGSRPSKPDFTFGELYAALVDYMSRIADMLNALRRMPRFSW